MKKRLLLILPILTFIVVICFSWAAAQEKAFVEPTLEQPGGWTLVVFPDPQQYTSTRNFPLIEIVMNWLVASREKLNIRQVVCVGDLVNANKSPEQWAFSSKAFAILDGVYPYALCLGNHDYGGPKVTGNTRETSFNDHYPATRNPAWKGVLTTMGKNTFGKETLENAVYETPMPNGQKFVVISLPFAPTQENLDWAKNIADQKKYDHAIVAILTHEYMLPDARKNLLTVSKGYILQKEGGASGKEIWDKLVYSSRNIRMVICGHHSGTNNHQDCTGFRVDKNASGRPVYQMVYDAQALGGGFSGNGGDGWLRLLEFSADCKHVKVKTFSPFFAISPSTQFLAWDRAPYNQFEFDIE